MIPQPIVELTIHKLYQRVLYGATNVFSRRTLFIYKSIFFTINSLVFDLSQPGMIIMQLAEDVKLY